jgi:hypothetical protein
MYLWSPEERWTPWFPKWFSPSPLNSSRNTGVLPHSHSKTLIIAGAIFVSVTPIKKTHLTIAQHDWHKTALQAPHGSTNFFCFRPTALPQLYFYEIRALRPLRCVRSCKIVLDDARLPPLLSDHAVWDKNIPCRESILFPCAMHFCERVPGHSGIPTLGESYIIIQSRLNSGVVSQPRKSV